MLLPVVYYENVMNVADFFSGTQLSKVLGEYMVE
jgi:hypothetical protein